MTHILVTRVLSSAYRGDLAIAQAMLEHLSRERQHWELTILCRHPQDDAHLFSAYGEVGGELFADVARDPSPLRVVLRVIRYWLFAVFRLPLLDVQGKSFLEACRRADLVVFCGGGSPGGYGLANLSLHAFIPGLLLKTIGKRPVFTGLGAERPRNPLHRMLMRSVLRNAGAICARDPLAVQTLRELGVKGSIQLTADWAFLLQRAAPPSPLAEISAESTETASLRIGLNLRAAVARGHENDQRDGSHYHQYMLQMVSGLLERTSAVIYVVSMTRSERTDDYEYAQALRADLRPDLQERLHLLDPNLDPAALKGAIGAMTVFVATRLHPLIFALAEGVPAVAIHDLRKVRGCMEYCGIAEWHVPFGETTAEEAVDRVLALLRDRDRVKAHIVQRTATLLAAASLNLEVIEQKLPNGEKNMHQGSVNSRPKREAS